MADGNPPHAAAETAAAAVAVGVSSDAASSTHVSDSQHDGETKQAIETFDKGAAGVDAEKGAAAVTQPAVPFDPAAGFPEGGTRAWLTVFGSFFALFVSFGWTNAIGIFQDYYQTATLSNLSPSTVAWIPSLELFVMFAVGPINGRVYDKFGPRYLLLAGTFLHVFGLMMTSLSTQYYQFILAQGICSPIGASAVFFGAVNSTSTWFFRRRAFATGIVASGSSLGGVIFPILVQNLIPKIGFPWTMRVCAFLILGLLTITNLTVTSRLPPSNSPFHISMMWRPFSERPFLLLATASFFIFFGLFIPFDFLILEAQAIGVDPTLASYLISILNAVSILGRTLPGYLGDKLGRFNVLTALCYLSGVLCLALWLPARGEAPIIVFAALYGFASGAFVGMLPAVTAQISPIREIGVRNGSLFAFIAIAALVGNPVAGALVNAEGGAYTHLQIFAGVMIVGGSSIMLMARTNLAGWTLKKV